MHMIIRKTLYQSILSGACGYTYGCNNIWQMYDAGRSLSVRPDLLVIFFDN